MGLEDSLSRKEWDSCRLHFLLKKSKGSVEDDILLPFLSTSSPPKTFIPHFNFGSCPPSSFNVRNDCIQDPKDCLGSLHQLRTTLDQYFYSWKDSRNEWIGSIIQEFLGKFLYNQKHRFSVQAIFEGKRKRMMMNRTKGDKGWTTEEMREKVNSMNKEKKRCEEYGKRNQVKRVNRIKKNEVKSRSV